MAGKGWGLYQDDRVVTVPTGQYRVGMAPAILVTLNLGSCVGVALYEPFSRLGGLAHIVLPGSATDASDNPDSYAETALSAMARDLTEMGCMMGLTVARLAGGANMFASLLAEDANDIGARNVECILECLTASGIRVMGFDVGGESPRRMMLDLSTGRVEVHRDGKVVTL